MKNLRKKIEPWIDKNYYVFSSFAFLIALLLFFIYFKKDKISDENDLIKISGNIKSYSFTSGSRGSKMYYFHLKNYSNTFQIHAEYLQFFKENEFRKEIKENDNLDLYISKSKYNDLNKKKKIIVYHINNYDEEYLSKIDTIGREKKLIEICAGIGFLMAVIIFYFIRRFLWKPNS